MIFVEIYSPTDFAVVGRRTDTGESFVDGPSSALLQPSPAAAAAVAVVGESCWANMCGSVRRPPKSLPVASVRHCSTLGPARSKDRRHVPLACADTGGSSVPQGPPADWMAKRLMRLCRDDLRFLQKLGEGRFAETYLGEIVRTTDERHSDVGKLVVIKMPRCNAGDNMRAEFLRITRDTMTRLYDANIANLLGSVNASIDGGSHQHPNAALNWFVFEHLSLGDLKQFLRRHRPASTSADTADPADNTLSHGSLIYMASQIASAMKYLESMNVVHGDLAARSCVVGDQYRVKVTDIGGDGGVARAIYPDDYTTAQFTVAPQLPIRWMAWEAVLLGEMSTKSDVWSFGVTLWEVLTLARLRRPLDDVLPGGDEAVFANLDACRRRLASVRRPPSPPGCPRELYDLMVECWQPDADLRPSFREMHMFLQRKNVGYAPGVAP